MHVHHSEQSLYTHTRDEIVDEIGHGEERAGGVEEVHVEECHERDPQAAAVEIAEAENSSCLGQAWHCDNFFEVGPAGRPCVPNPTCMHALFSM